MQFAFLKDCKTAAQRLCCMRKLLGVAASVKIKIAPLISNFTEPDDYATCCKTPDYLQWLGGMIKEIKGLEKMGYWNIVKLTSLPPGAKLINRRWVCKLKYRDGLYERHHACLVAMGYQQEKGRDYFESFSPTCSHSTIRLVLALTTVPGWYLLDLDAVCAFISSDLAPGERVYMKGPAGYNIGATWMWCLRKCASKSRAVIRWLL